MLEDIDREEPLTFNYVESIHNPIKRGLAFEKLLVQFFSESGYNAIHDPKTVKPKQVDLLIKIDDVDFLVEARWRKRKAGPKDLVFFRSKLDELPSDVAGIFISMSGFSKNAIESGILEMSRLTSLYHPIIRPNPPHIHQLHLTLNNIELHYLSLILFQCSL